MWTVHEVSRLTGVSVRALHHYDAIDLLKPAEITEAGYRLYDDVSLCRLQNILMFRELRFPLKEIKVMLDNPNFDSGEALTQQIKLLKMQQKHIGELISLAYKIKEKGVDHMDFNAFQYSEMEQYKKEVRERWGNTKAYQEYQERTINITKREQMDAASGLMTLFADVGALRSLSPDHDKVQKKIREIQSFITENYYNCTDEIFSNLGDMYVGDERMRKSIDKAGGDGTAEFVRKAIAHGCSAKD